MGVKVRKDNQWVSLSGGGGVAAVPSKTIVMYHGDIAPSGWVLCDDSAAAQAAGAPDLRDKFIVASGSSYSRTDTGGSANATLVSHTHGAGSYSALSNGAHTHTYTHNNSSTSLDNDEGNSTIYPNLGTYNTGSAGAHTHSVSGSSGSSGSSAGNANLPPYYALCYIMKA